VIYNGSEYLERQPGSYVVDVVGGLLELHASQNNGNMAKYLLGVLTDNSAISGIVVPPPDRKVTGR
jgi:hypothetical protein